jgi:hypothetical protein
MPRNIQARSTGDDVKLLNKCSASFPCDGWRATVDENVPHAAGLRHAHFCEAACGDPADCPTGPFSRQQ